MIEDMKPIRIKCKADAQRYVGKIIKYLRSVDIDKSGRGYYFPRYMHVSKIERGNFVDTYGDYVYYRDILYLHIESRIVIHFDFTDGSEVSFEEGRALRENFKTHCLDFFNNDEPVEDVIVMKKDGSYISRRELLQGDIYYINKEIRHEHNIHKMLVAGSFNFKPASHRN